MSDNRDYSDKKDGENGKKREDSTNPIGHAADFRSNNNSFAMADTPILASTRPYDGNSAAERFLAEGVMAGSLNQPSTNSSFVSIPRAMQTKSKPSTQPVLVSSESSVAAPKPVRAVPPSGGSTVSQTSNNNVRKVPPPSLTVSETSPSALRSSSTTSNQTAVYRDPASLSATQRPPVFTASESSSPPKVSPAMEAFHNPPIAPSRVSPRRGSKPSRGGSPSSFRYSPVSPNMGAINEFPEPHRRSPYAATTGRRSPRIGFNDNELTSLFSGTPSSRRKTPSSSGGLNTGSVSSRPRGSVQANSVSVNDLSAPPSWMGAVERLNASRVKSYEPSALPIDKSRLGLQQRRQQQNTLTVGRLRAFEEQHTPHSATDTPGTATGRRSQNFPLVAHEEAVAVSESTNARRNRIRASTSSKETPTVFAGDYCPKNPHTSIYASESSNPIVPFKTFLQKLNNKKDNHLPPGGIIVASESAGNMKSSGTNNNNGNSNRNSNNTPYNNNNDNSYNDGGSYNNRNNSNNNNRNGGPDGGGAGGGNGGGGGGGGGGGDGGGDNGNSNLNSTVNRRKLKRKALETGQVEKSEALRKAFDAGGDEEGREERNLKVRNMNAIHAIPWDQRRQMPMSGFGTRFFSLLSSPRFWEKMDWTIRGAILTILPTMILALEPTTTDLFPMSSSLAFNAFWISSGTFGSGMKEFFIAFKGFSFGLVILVIVIAINPGPEWLSLLLLFLFTLISSFVAEETKKNAAYVITSTVMAYIKCPRGSVDEGCKGPNEVNFDYVGVYYSGLLCALAFALAAFLIPFIRWSSRIATHYISAMGNGLSIQVQGTCLSFWTDSPLERELNVLRIRQLRMMVTKCIEKIETALAETAYEPHTGKYVAILKTRFHFCMSIHNILGSMTQVVELISDNPSITDTPMCQEFGAQIGEEVAVIASAIDSMILKIVDFHQYVTPVEILIFRQARERFQEALSVVRENVILNNESYETDEADIYLGFFMFSIDELCEVIANFEEDPHPRNNIVHYLKFVVRDVESSLAAFKNLFISLVYNRRIPRRLKEAIKLSLCMTIPSIFQVYAFNLNDMSAFGGASIIALIYNPTGSESFHYASGRLLGTVLGSTASYLCVQIASGRRWVLYIFIALLSLIGCYVQASPGFYALGNAIACSTISVITQYQDLNAAMTRIQQNSFAILIYFAITSLIWPMRARKRVRMGLDVSLRCLRESCARLLRNLDMPLDASEVAADVSALLKEMNKKIIVQSRFISGAVEEPTMSSAEYPEEQMRRIVVAERRIWSTLSLMRFAYNSFMSSNTEGTELSVHWVVLHRIAPYAQDLADLVYSVIDLYLLSLSKTTVVPTSHLARIRLAMIESENAIINTYIETIQRKVTGLGDEEDGGEYGDYDDYDDSYSGDSSSPPATITSGMHPDREDGDADYQPPVKPSGGEPDTKPEDREKSNDKKDEDSKKAEGTKKAEDTKKDEDTKGATNGKEGTKKKKVGYLGYQLTDEEKDALRNFIAGRVNNNSFTNNSMVANVLTKTNNNNNSIALSGGSPGGMSFGGTANLFNNNNTFTSRASAALSGQNAAVLSTVAGVNGATAASFGTTGDNTNRLMALAGNDTGLAAELRKKHGVKSKTEKREEEMAEMEKQAEKNDKKKDKKDDSGSDNEMFNNTLSNASFLKNNSFLKNTSFIGALFKRSNKKKHDLDDELEEREGSEKGKKKKKDDGSSKRSNSTSSSSSSSEDQSASLSATARTHTPAPAGSHKADSRTPDLTPDLKSDEGNMLEYSPREGSKRSFTGDDPTPVKEDKKPEKGEKKPEKEEKKPEKEEKKPETTAAKEEETKKEPSNDKDEEEGSGDTVKKTVSPKTSSSDNEIKKEEAEKSQMESNSDYNDTLDRTKTDKLDKTGKEKSLASTTNKEQLSLLFPTYNGGGGEDPDEMLNNISFFDADRGEFVLTNHDIHSLEAFLFGTRALVTYINELQNAILDMQHCSELAKFL